MDDETRGRLMECFREYPPETEHKGLFGVGFDIRQRGYLTKEEYTKIVKWKLGGYFDRMDKEVKKRVENIGKDKVKEHTRKGLSAGLLEEKVGNLKKLPAVGLAVATAILAVVRPDKYGIIDVNAWEALRDLGYDLREEYKTVRDFRQYLQILEEIGDRLDLTPREVDAMLWKYGKELE